MKIEIEWEVHGRVFINGKYSHTAKIQLPHLHAHTWEDDEDGKGSRMMGTLEGRSLDRIFESIKSECERIVSEKFESLRALRQFKGEYPYARKEK